MELICLSGYAGSGKSAAAQVLVEEFGFRRVSFADRLREALYVLNPIVGNDWSDTQSRLPEHMFLQDLIDEHGWQGYKKTPHGPEVRRLMQVLGTGVGRDLISKNVWIDATFDTIDVGEKIVIDDGRFIGEFDTVRERGGFVWRVDRPGVGPVNDHSSETQALEYKKFSIFLENNGTLQQWKDLIIREYRSGRYREW